MDDKNKYLPGLFDQHFHEMVKAVDSFFGDSLKHVSQFFEQSIIPIEVFETAVDFKIEAYLPHVEREQIRIDRAGSRLRILVEEQMIREVNDEKKAYYNQSQSFSKRERIIPLPFDVADTSSSASFKNGVLTIVFPKKSSTIDLIDVEDVD
ncbi:Hsp20/alpha crystallin family protein [Halobacillus litoralis]|uniref:Hsp20/alpha crystallin family protein n=1 Tax=Halobacillus litoralis TaxID=45668 RepID=UPI001CFE561F|nr:Hsp20/alpha crystallin family protein [Halobacillus litoralis]